MKSPLIAIVILSIGFCNIGCYPTYITGGNANTGKRFDYIKTNKPRQYFDAEGAKVTRKEFEAKVDYAYVIDRNIEFDTFFESRLFYRQRFGKLSKAKFKNFITNLEVSTGLTLDQTVPIMIGYFHEPTPSEHCTVFYHSAHWAALKEHANRNYYSIANNKLDFDKQILECSYDSSGVMERLFFSQNIACSNWIALKPDGSYRIFYGEGGAQIFEKEEILMNWDEKFIAKKSQPRK